MQKAPGKGKKLLNLLLRSSRSPGGSASGSVCCPPRPAARLRARWVLLLVMLAGLVPAGVISAETGGRRVYTSQQGMVHVWTLKAWKDNALLCEIFRSDEKTPGGEDIQAYCGDKVYEKWFSSPPCTSFLKSGKTDTCEGSYLTYLGYYYRLYSTYETLPGPGITLAVEGCRPGQWCSQAPILLLTGVEPLQGHQIVEIAYQSGGVRSGCLSTDTCSYRVPLTQQEGMWLEYWAVSSYGDESEHHTIHLRNLYRGANGGEYLLDILSPDTFNDFAALTWDIFPTAEHPNAGLFLPPGDETGLQTTHNLYYLAGKLIFTGEVNASACVGSGLLENNMANACGEESASAAVSEWQNRYNNQIFTASGAYQLPPRIIKAIIAQESQFWPVSDRQFEYGLGSLSENGVDVLLTWDVQSFLDLCIPTYDEETCAAGYSSLKTEQRAMLRGLALRAVGTDDEIDLITRVLRANVLQVNQMMENLADFPLALETSYEDLWYLTLANYHAGNTCVASGVKSLLDNEQELTFENYCTLVSLCPTACLFVERVMQYGVD